MQDSLPAGGLRLYREGVEPSGSLRKVSGYIPFSFPGLVLSQGWSMPSRPLADPALCSPTCPATPTGSLLPNSRLVAFDGERVTFKWKDYRAKGDARYKLMTLDADEFIRRFLIHVLPDGFHRIRHYGLFANANRLNNIALARRLLGAPDPAPSSRASDPAENGRNDEAWNACPCCGGRMIIIETFEPGCQPRLWPLPSIGLDSS